MKKSLSVVAMLTFLTVSATAAADGYGPAGCGLGSLIIGSKPGFTQVFASTTNGTFANQTFGISSGTSNCDGAGAATEQKAAKVFIEANREALAKDIARGSGETIETLADIAGCGDSAAVGVSLQKSFKVIFTSSQMTSEDVSTNVIKSLQSNTALACKSVG
jgi:hypothetical protein